VQGKNKMAQGAVSPEFKHNNPFCHKSSKQSELEFKISNTTLALGFAVLGGGLATNSGYFVYQSIAKSEYNSMFETHIAGIGAGLIIMTYGLIAGYISNKQS
jgi:hypothetical protein